VNGDQRASLMLVMAVLVTGSGKKQPDPAGGGKEGDVASGDPVMIKFAKKQAGVKYQVLETITEDQLMLEPGTKPKPRVTELKYVEIIEQVDDKNVMTKGKRICEKAETTDKGKSEKTVKQLK
jgi:hypothetical protein